ncbi:MAG TPA: FKBP-type peptidyl-prolyl cis-trans isomerase [Pyrinomonadaceae bacterium]|jgi:peptidylprolyl isomerase|nr:FKBP-type peptidyl-prolyl cis-trans isomerase [Pyrinomonadaceae bacterium]
MKLKIVLAAIFLTFISANAFSIQISQSGSGTIMKAEHRRQARKPHKTRKPKPPKIEQAGITTASGLTYVITQHGMGRQPEAGETVIVNYTGLLGNGTKFDSSLDHGQTFEFPLGAGRVIKGWDEGIAKLHVGDQATLIIPAAIGYGERGSGGVIPPNATLIFLVELVGIKEPATPGQD